jgi:hypothetical protein
MNVLRHWSVCLILLMTSQAGLADVKFNALKDFGFGGTASGINSRGVIVGSAVVDAEFSLEPVYWKSREEAPVLLPSDGSGGGATAINNNGLIVGYKLFGSLSTPVIWIDGVVIDLPTLGDGGYPLDINDQGHVVGAVYVGTSVLPALWKNGELTVLPVPPSDSAGDVISAAASRINSSGEIIGTVRYASDSSAVRWSGGNVRSIVVNSWQETRGIGISDAGDVLVNGYLDGTGSFFSLGTLSSKSVPASLATPLFALGVWGNDYSSNGIAAGYSLFSSDGVSTLRASAWREGSLEHLELPIGAIWAFPLGVSNEGTVVGSVSDGVSGVSLAGYWQLSTDIVDVAPLAAAPTEEVLLSASVRSGKSVVAGRSVQFTVAGTKVGSATTDKAGKATLKYKVPTTAKLGTHSLAATSSKGGEDSATLTLDRMTPRLTVSSVNASPNQTVQVTGALSEAKTQKVLPNETVSFQYGGKRYTGKTNAKGVYSIPFTVPRTQKPRTQIPLDIQYAGSQVMKSSAARGSIAVK